MELAPGTKLGPYEIVAPIGAGGMGEVFQARDTRLDRIVAVKVMPKHIAAREDLRARFEREARTVSRLNHPNICVLFDIGRQDGTDFMVLEYLEGETLAARIARGRMPVDQVLKHAGQIADALDRAHRSEVSHRDVKPANVMMTRNGCKVLDFGLAKTAPRATGPDDETLTASLTSEGTIPGTPQYMAPEQYEGREADARSDIFAFGCVVYEMVTGKRCFEGKTRASVIAAVLGGTPVPMSRLAPMTPTALERLVKRCLAKDPEDRYQSMRDIVLELREIAVSGTDSPAPLARRQRRWMWAFMLLAFASGIAVIAMLPGRGTRTPAPASRFVLSLVDKGGNEGQFSIPTPSPDGRFLVFQDTSAGSLQLRSLNSEKTSELPGTAGAKTFFWSPDSRWIAFFVDGKLKKVSPEGGLPQTMAAVPDLQEAVWSSSGDILFRPKNREPLFRLPVSGGAPIQVTHLDASRAENSHRGLQFLPDGRRFLFTARCAQRENNALYLGSLDSPVLKRIMPVDSNAHYLPPRSGQPGMLLYYRDGGLVAQSFDPDRAVVSGDPAPVIDRVDYNATGITAYFKLSADGRVAVVQPAGANETQPAWFDRNGEESGKLGPRGNYQQLRISPDGNRVLFSRPDPRTGNRDLFELEIARGVTSRLTTHVANDWFAVWSPDGTQIVFGSDRDGGTSMLSYIKKSMDPGSGESRFPGEEPLDWSRDGRWLALNTGGRDIGVAPAVPDGKPFPYLATPFREGGARFSPDGRWLAYVSDETGQFEVYVRPFAGAPAPEEGKIRISSKGGDFPVWKPDGQELYYMAPDRAIYAADTRSLGHSGAAPSGVRLFGTCPGTSISSLPATDATYMAPYDTHDGKRFLVNCNAEPRGRFSVLLNWPFGPQHE